MLARLAATAITAATRLLTGARTIWMAPPPPGLQRVYFANHSSHGDFVLLWSSLETHERVRTRPVAGADYWNGDPLRRFIGQRVFRAVLVDRNPATRTADPVEQMIEAIDADDSLILFPEGTRNLTEERLDKLSAVPFEQLPLKNTFSQVRGNGKRKLVVFADPNCGFCKRFEKDLQKLDNVTIQHVLYPILGEDSKTKSRHIWCAKDRAKAWNDWMIQGVTPPAASCDTAAIEANVEFGKKNRITGTPTLFFADGSRVVGAVPLTQIEQQLAQVK